MSEPAEALKCTLVGSGLVGKSCLVRSYQQQGPLSESQLTERTWDTEAFTKTLSMGSRSRDLLVFEAKEYAVDRTGSTLKLDLYRSDVFLLCFSVDDPESFSKVTSRYLPLIHSSMHRPTPILLLGLQADSREDADRIRALKASGLEFVSKEDALKLAKDIKAVCYMECSARTYEGVESMFQAAFKAAMIPPAEEGDQKTPSSKCSIS